MKKSLLALFSFLFGMLSALGGVIVLCSSMVHAAYGQRLGLTRSEVFGDIGLMILAWVLVAFIAHKLENQEV
jgi:hypothetical protein